LTVESDAVIHRGVFQGDGVFEGFHCLGYHVHAKKIHVQEYQ
jgi:hypothetical protein